MHDGEYLNVEQSNKWYFLCLSIHLICAHYFYGQIGDDGFIFFRYADNLVNGYGLVWNPFETPVEGYSSPLWVLVLALISIFCDIVNGAQALGTFCMVLATWRVWQLSKVLNGHPLIATLGGCLGLGVHYWASAGLETGLYALIFLSSVLAVLQQASMFWIALLGLCRPEGIFLVPLAFGVCGYSTGHWKENWWVFIPMGLWLVFRIVYYGDVLPNTYYTKVSGGFWERVLTGLVYAMWVTFSLVLGMICDSKRRSIWIFPLGLLLIIIVGGGDWMWNGRLLIPIYLTLWAFCSALSGWSKIICCLPLCSLWIPPQAFAKILQGQKMPERAYQEGSLVSVSEEVAQQISANFAKGSVVAVNHAGALPYFLSGYSFLDMTGLNNHHIAHLEGKLHHKYDPEYILEQAPDLVVMNSFSNPAEQGFVADYWEGETALYDSTQFKERYVPIAQSWERIRSGGGRAYIVLFKKRAPKPSSD